MIAYAVKPIVAPKVATAAFRTLSGVYKEQMKETRYDSARVKMESRAPLRGEVVEAPGTHKSTMMEIKETTQEVQKAHIF